MYIYMGLISDQENSDDEYDVDIHRNAFYQYSGSRDDYPAAEMELNEIRRHVDRISLKGAAYLDGKAATAEQR